MRTDRIKFYMFCKTFQISQGVPKPPEVRHTVKKKHLSKNLHIWPVPLMTLTLSVNWKSGRPTNMYWIEISRTYQCKSSINLKDLHVPILVNWKFQALQDFSNKSWLEVSSRTYQYTLTGNCPHRLVRVCRGWWWRSWRLCPPSGDRVPVSKWGANSVGAVGGCRYRHTLR